MITITLEDAKAITGELISNPKIQDDKYRYAYIDGVLDYFNKLKTKEK